ncbi:MAG: PIN domain-containing protein [Nanoarchaeota archaeon]|nr:PIN domain-containing protein [Nanoarchaeota archaeon]
MVVKCLDTYALMEIYNGNPKFSDYLSSNSIITGETIAEFYGVLLKEHDIEEADFWYKKLKFLVKNVSFEILVKAIKFKFENRKKGVSFFDSVGYIYSIENNLIFVTGDKEFEGLKNVEFIKK